MFTLPQVLEGQNSNNTKGDLPVIQVTEGSRTLEILLTMCYPATVVDPPMAGPRELEDVRLLLGAAIKYDIEKVVKRACTWMVSRRFLRSNPVMVYAIACQWNLEKEAKVAARSTVGLNALRQPLGEELDIMTARQFHALLRYNGDCNAAMRKVVNNFRRYNFYQFGCMSCGNSQSHIRFSSKWLGYYLQNVAEAVTDDSWNGAEKSRLMKAAVQVARECAFCCTTGPIRVAGVSFTLKKEMDKAISEVSPGVQHPRYHFDSQHCQQVVLDFLP